MVRVLGIEFAPLFMPMARRVQTLVVIWYVLVFTLWPYLCVALVVALLFTRLYWLALAYVAWIFYDVVVLETSSHGGRRSHWLRNHKIWHYFRDYFPVELVKTAEFDPTRNYILGYHPHGIIGCGCMASFATEATGFSQKFPGITVHQLTLKTNFSIPLLRGFLLYWGMCDVSKESIRYLMTQSGRGVAAVIVVGGAEEALESHPGVYRLTMKRRKGFVRIALQTGADLVPTYSFGENDLFQQADNPHGSRLRQFQEKVKRVTGIAPPVFYGRGIFNYSFGFLPFRNPIHTVVGAPIRVEQDPEPSQELVDEYHAKYLNGLSELFNQHKQNYGIDKDKVLEFI